MSTKVCRKCNKACPIERMEWATCRDCKTEYQRQYRKANKEKTNAYQRAAYARNPEKHKQMVKASVKKNYSATLARNAEYRASRHNATPEWLSEGDRERIRDIYEQSTRQSTTEGDVYHVDHIVPLKGKTVCGLHVPWNLQIILGSENIRKSNKENVFC